MSDIQMEHTAPARTKVWDIGVRLFHWSLLTTVAGAYLIVDPRYLHRWLGYVVIGLIAFRLIWGLIGSRHARFSSFLTGPMADIGYLRDIWAGTERRYLGHNPAGAAMIVALLTVLTGICATGIMMGQDAYFGVAWVEHLHGSLVTALLVLVALHLSGVILASWRHRENLVAAMVHGHKDIHEDAPD